MRAADVERRGGRAECSVQVDMLTWELCVCSDMVVCWSRASGSESAVKGRCRASESESNSRLPKRYSHTKLRAEAFHCAYALCQWKYNTEHCTIILTTTTPPIENVSLSVFYRHDRRLFSNLRKYCMSLEN